MSSVRRELTDDDKKLIINLNNNNYTQEFFASTLNVSQSCISKFSVGLARARCCVLPLLTSVTSITRRLLDNTTSVGRCLLSVPQVYTENSVVRSLLLVPQGRKIASIFRLSETYI